MFFLYSITIVLISISLIANHRKTVKAFKVALRKFLYIMPAFLTMLILVSITFYFITDKLISEYLGGDNTLISTLVASFLGSITLMPGFIAFPLSGILLQNGVPYMVLSAFTTTLMMVGVLTYPVEKKYFGAKMTLLRNAASFLIALVIAVVTGLFFGEIF